MSDNFGGESETKKGIYVLFIYITLEILFIGIGILSGCIIGSNKKDIFPTNTISQINDRRIHLDTQTSQYIIHRAIPLLEINAGEDDPFILLYLNWSAIYWQIAANIRNTSPQEILKSQFSIIPFIKPRTLPIKLLTKTVPIPHPLEIPTPVEPSKLVANEPQILIYHTHTSECYIPVSGKDREFNNKPGDNKKGDVVKIGEYLQQTLEDKYGIKCIHSEEINDCFPFRESYLRAREVAQKYIKEYPSIKVVLDVHRDATPGFKTTCEINGGKTATLFFVIGSDKMGLPHPNWRKNMEFATKLTKNMNLYYSELSNGIVTSDARYNQDLHDHAIIVEMGNYKDSTSEYLYRTVEKFAEILALTLKEENV
jgi:stage II sporulation protein P